MVRTNQLFKRFSKTANYYYLSGLLMGTELNYLAEGNAAAITIAGDEKLVINYTLALKVLGVKTQLQTADAAIATIKGQFLIYQQACSS